MSNFIRGNSEENKLQIDLSNNNTGMFSTTNRN